MASNSNRPQGGASNAGQASLLFGVADILLDDGGMSNMSKRTRSQVNLEGVDIAVLDRVLPEDADERLEQLGIHFDTGPGGADGNGGSSSRGRGASSSLSSSLPTSSRKGSGAGKVKGSRHAGRTAGGSSSGAAKQSRRRSRSKGAARSSKSGRDAEGDISIDLQEDSREAAAAAAGGGQDDDDDDDESFDGPSDDAEDEEDEEDEEGGGGGASAAGMTPADSYRIYRNFLEKLRNPALAAAASASSRAGSARAASLSTEAAIAASSSSRGPHSKLGSSNQQQRGQLAKMAAVQVPTRAGSLPTTSSSSSAGAAVASLAAADTLFMADALFGQPLQTSGAAVGGGGGAAAQGAVGGVLLQTQAEGLSARAAAAAADNLQSASDVSRLGLTQLDVAVGSAAGGGLTSAATDFSRILGGHLLPQLASSASFAAASFPISVGSQAMADAAVHPRSFDDSRAGDLGLTRLGGALLGGGGTGTDSATVEQLISPALVNRGSTEETPSGSSSSRSPRRRAAMAAAAVTGAAGAADSAASSMQAGDAASRNSAMTQGAAGAAKAAHRGGVPQPAGVYSADSLLLLNLTDDEDDEEEFRLGDDPDGAAGVSAWRGKRKRKRRRRSRIAAGEQPFMCDGGVEDEDEEEEEDEDDFFLDEKTYGKISARELEDLLEDARNPIPFAPFLASLNTGASAGNRQGGVRTSNVAPQQLSSQQGRAGELQAAQAYGSNTAATSDSAGRPSSRPKRAGRGGSGGAAGAVSGMHAADSMELLQGSTSSMLGEGGAAGAVILQSQTYLPHHAEGLLLSTAAAAAAAAAGGGEGGAYAEDASVSTAESKRKRGRSEGRRKDGSSRYSSRNVSPTESGARPYEESYGLLQSSGLQSGQQQGQTDLLGLDAPLGRRRGSSGGRRSRKQQGSTSPAAARPSRSSSTPIPRLPGQPAKRTERLHRQKQWQEAAALLKEALGLEMPPTLLKQMLGGGSLRQGGLASEASSSSGQFALSSFLSSSGSQSAGGEQLAPSFMSLMGYGQGGAGGATGEEQSDYAAALPLSSSSSSSSALPQLPISRHQLALLSVAAIASRPAAQIPPSSSAPHSSSWRQAASSATSALHAAPDDIDMGAAAAAEEELAGEATRRPEDSVGLHNLPPVAALGLDATYELQEQEEQQAPASRSSSSSRPKTGPLQVQLSSQQLQAALLRNILQIRAEKAAGQQGSHASAGSQSVVEESFVELLREALRRLQGYSHLASGATAAGAEGNDDRAAAAGALHHEDEAGAPMQGSQVADGREAAYWREKLALFLQERGGSAAAATDRGKHLSSQQQIQSLLQSPSALTLLWVRYALTRHRQAQTAATGPPSAATAPPSAEDAEQAESLPQQPKPAAQLHCVQLACEVTRLQAASLGPVSSSAETEGLDELVGQLSLSGTEASLLATAARQGAPGALSAARLQALSSLPSQVAVEWDGEALGRLQQQVEGEEEQTQVQQQSCRQPKGQLQHLPEAIQRATMPVSKAGILPLHSSDALKKAGLLTASAFHLRPTQAGDVLEAAAASAVSPNTVAPDASSTGSESSSSSAGGASSPSPLPSIAPFMHLLQPKGAALAAVDAAGLIPSSCQLPLLPQHFRFFTPEQYAALQSSLDKHVKLSCQLLCLLACAVLRQMDFATRLHLRKCNALWGAVRAAADAMAQGGSGSEEGQAPVDPMLQLQQRLQEASVELATDSPADTICQLLPPFKLSETGFPFLPLPPGESLAASGCSDGRKATSNMVPLADTSAADQHAAAAVHQLQRCLAMLSQLLSLRKTAELQWGRQAVDSAAPAWTAAPVVHSNATQDDLQHAEAQQQGAFDMAQQGAFHSSSSAAAASESVLLPPQQRTSGQKEEDASSDCSSTIHIDSDAEDLLPAAATLSKKGAQPRHHTQVAAAAAAASDFDSDSDHEEVIDLDEGEGGYRQPAAPSASRDGTSPSASTFPAVHTHRQKAGHLQMREVPQVQSNQHSPEELHRPTSPASVSAADILLAASDRAAAEAAASEGADASMQSPHSTPAAVSLRRAERLFPQDSSNGMEDADAATAGQQHFQRQLLEAMSSSSSSSSLLSYVSAELLEETQLVAPLPASLTSLQEEAVLQEEQEQYQQQQQQDELMEQEGSGSGSAETPRLPRGLGVFRNNGLLTRLGRKQASSAFQLHGAWGLLRIPSYLQVQAQQHQQYLLQQQIEKHRGRAMQMPHLAAGIATPARSLFETPLLKKDCTVTLMALLQQWLVYEARNCCARMEQKKAKLQKQLVSAGGLLQTWATVQGNGHLQPAPTAAADADVSFEGMGAGNEHSMHRTTAHNLQPSSFLSLFLSSAAAADMQAGSDEEEEHTSSLAAGIARHYLASPPAVRSRGRSSAAAAAAEGGAGNEQEEVEQPGSAAEAPGLLSQPVLVAGLMEAFYTPAQPLSSLLGEQELAKMDSAQLQEMLQRAEKEEKELQLQQQQQQQQQMLTEEQADGWPSPMDIKQQLIVQLRRVLLARQRKELERRAQNLEEEAAAGSADDVPASRPFTLRAVPLRFPPPQDQSSLGKSRGVIELGPDEMETLHEALQKDTHPVAVATLLWLQSWPIAAVNHCSLLLGESEPLTAAATALLSSLVPALQLPLQTAKTLSKCIQLPGRKEQRREEESDEQAADDDEEEGEGRADGGRGQGSAKSSSSSSSSKTPKQKKSSLKGQKAAERGAADRAASLSATRLSGSKRRVTFAGGAEEEGQESDQQHLFFHSDFSDGQASLVQEEDEEDEDRGFTRKKRRGSSGGSRRSSSGRGRDAGRASKLTELLEEQNASSWQAAAAGAHPLWASGGGGATPHDGRGGASTGRRRRSNSKQEGGGAAAAGGSPLRQLSPEQELAAAVARTLESGAYATVLDDAGMESSSPASAVSPMLQGQAAHGSIGAYGSTAGVAGGLYLGSSNALGSVVVLNQPVDGAAAALFAAQQANEAAQALHEQLALEQQLQQQNGHSFEHAEDARENSGVQQQQQYEQYAGAGGTLEEQGQASHAPPALATAASAAASSRTYGGLAHAAAGEEERIVLEPLQPSAVSSSTATDASGQGIGSQQEEGGMLLLDRGYASSMMSGGSLYGGFIAAQAASAAASAAAAVAAEGSAQDSQQPAGQRRRRKPAAPRKRNSSSRSLITGSISAPSDVTPAGEDGMAALVDRNALASAASSFSFVNGGGGSMPSKLLSSLAQQEQAGTAGMGGMHAAPISIGKLLLTDEQALLEALSGFNQDQLHVLLERSSQLAQLDEMSLFEEHLPGHRPLQSGNGQKSKENSNSSSSGINSSSSKLLSGRSEGRGDGAGGALGAVSLQPNTSFAQEAALTATAASAAAAANFNTFFASQAATQVGSGIGLRPDTTRSESRRLQDQDKSMSASSGTADAINTSSRLVGDAVPSQVLSSSDASFVISPSSGMTGAAGSAVTHAASAVALPSQPPPPPSAALQHFSSSIMSDLSTASFHEGQRWHASSVSDSLSPVAAMPKERQSRDPQEWVQVLLMAQRRFRAAYAVEEDELLFWGNLRYGPKQHKLISWRLLPYRSPQAARKRVSHALRMVKEKKERQLQDYLAQNGLAEQGSRVQQQSTEDESRVTAAADARGAAAKRAPAFTVGKPELLGELAAAEECMNCGVGNCLKGLLLPAGGSSGGGAGTERAESSGDTSSTAFPASDRHKDAERAATTTLQAEKQEVEEQAGEEDDEEELIVIEGDEQSSAAAQKAGTEAIARTQQPSAASTPQEQLLQGDSSSSSSRPSLLWQELSLLRDAMAVYGQSSEALSFISAAILPQWGPGRLLQMWGQLSLSCVAAGVTGVMPQTTPSAFMAGADDREALAARGDAPMPLLGLSAAAASFPSLQPLLASEEAGNAVPVPEVLPPVDPAFLTSLLQARPSEAEDDLWSGDAAGNAVAGGSSGGAGFGPAAPFAASVIASYYPFGPPAGTAALSSSSALLSSAGMEGATLGGGITLFGQFNAAPVAPSSSIAQGSVLPASQLPAAAGDSEAEGAAARGSAAVAAGATRVRRATRGTTAAASAPAAATASTTTPAAMPKRVPLHIVSLGVGDAGQQQQGSSSNSAARQTSSGSTSVEL